eukprot:GHVP01031051.1.p1 GENE.GHVP01031051.1~~GHVP01031051.1.p1  ORF type:complete len:223 (+),score=35.05 GHVP01031051.1:22-669(+)
MTQEFIQLSQILGASTDAEILSTPEIIVQRTPSFHLQENLEFESSSGHRHRRSGERRRPHHEDYEFEYEEAPVSRVDIVALGLTSLFFVVLGAACFGEFGLWGDVTLLPKVMPGAAQSKISHFQVDQSSISIVKERLENSKSKSSRMGGGKAHNNGAIDHNVLREALKMNKQLNTLQGQGARMPYYGGIDDPRDVQPGPGDKIIVPTKYQPLNWL